ncbi:MAG: hypothetical protein M1818_000516 [Claussenomyces sp. TS43310]|nr:MAG: hypothetical protein M1818_000516 [Claussenomyces sp. TS43310]
MPSLFLKAAGRPALRRPLHPWPRPQPGPSRTKRQNSSNNNNNNNNNNSLTSPSQQPRKASADASNTSAAGTSIPVPSTVATLPLWQRLGPLTRCFEAYARAQRKRPYVTQFCTSLVIYFLGDLSAQSIGDDEYDPVRAGRALVISAGSSIPSYKWFLFLGNHFNFASRALSLGTKIVVNQLAFTPIFNAYFFGMQSLLANLPAWDPAAVWAHVRRTVPRSFVNSWKLWPAVTAFSFTFVEPQYRSLFAGLIAVGWQTYLSYLNQQADHLEAVEHHHLETARSPDLHPHETKEVQPCRPERIGQPT